MLRELFGVKRRATTSEYDIVSGYIDDKIPNAIARLILNAFLDTNDKFSKSEMRSSWDCTRCQFAVSVNAVGHREQCIASIIDTTSLFFSLDK